MTLNKRYLTISEASKECAIKPHVLRYWEKEFPTLRPERRAGRRYYQDQHLQLILKIKRLLYEQGFTIAGARRYLASNEARQQQRYEHQTLRSLRLELEDILKQLALRY